MSAATIGYSPSTKRRLILHLPPTIYLLFTRCSSMRLPSVITILMTIYMHICFYHPEIDILNEIMLMTVQELMMFYLTISI